MAAAFWCNSYGTDPLGSTVTRSLNTIEDVSSVTALHFPAGCTVVCAERVGVLDKSVVAVVDMRRAEFEQLRRHSSWSEVVWGPPGTGHADCDEYLRVAQPRRCMGLVRNVVECGSLEPAGRSVYGIIGVARLEPDRVRLFVSWITM